MQVYKGCKIYISKCAPCVGQYVWDEIEFGIQSEDAFDTIEQAKADIDQYFGDAQPLRLDMFNELV